jgi:hypothetical protein
LGGYNDPFYGDHLYTLPVAVEEGFDSNTEWLHRHIEEAISNQENSPHKIVILNAGHVPSIKQSNASNYVDAFIDSSMQYNAGYPFASK